MNTAPSIDPIADVPHAPVALRHAWAWHLSRPEAAYVEAERAYEEAKAARHEHGLAWAALCKALAGYRWIGHDVAKLRTDFIEATQRMLIVGDARGERLASLAPAVLAMKRGDWHSALSEYELLIGTFDLQAQDPDNFYPLLGLSTSYVYCGNLAEGMRFGYLGMHLARRFDLAAQQATMSLPLGVALMAARDAQEAATLWQEVLPQAERVDSPMLVRTIRTNLSVALRRLGRLHESQAEIERALADPTAMIGGSQFAHFAAAELYVALNRPDDAAEQLSRALGCLEGAPLIALDEAKVHYIAGLIASRRGDFEDAIEHFEQTTAILPNLEARRFSDRSQVYDDLAAAYAATGRFEQAYRAQKRASDDFLANVEVLNRARHFSLQMRRELTRVRSSSEADVRQHRELLEANRQLREQLAASAQAVATFREAALHDALTALPNRLLLDKALPTMLALAKQAATPLAIALINLDHFQSINERYGQAAGDQVLRHFGQLAPTFLRGADLVARYGGDTFCAVFTSCGSAAAVKRLTELRCSVGKGIVTMDEQPLTGIDFSAGIAIYPDDGVLLDDLMAVADRRLSRAKRQGRAAIVCDDVDQLAAD